MSHPTTVSYSVKALTDIWTGDADRKGDRLTATGLLGSIRWWFEALVRGLDGAACDPSFEDRRNHPQSSRCPDPAVKELSDPGHHCVVCELFGCTGWARKFRFEVRDQNDQVQATKIKKDETFKLRFTELRPVRPEEWALLDLTLRFIADYGAIGGRTVLKPSDEPSRANRPQHQDYGIIEICKGPDGIPISKSKDAIERYLTRKEWRKVNHGCFGWASLDNFWYVKGRYLARQDSNTSSFNRVIGRPEPKAQASQNDSWVAGYRPNPQQNIEAESKKVFSFKAPARTFGFVQNSSDLNNLVSLLKSQLAQEWAGFQDRELNTGKQILRAIIS